MSTNSASQLGETEEPCSSGDNIHRYDAVLVVSFGGPEDPSDVMPFLENVLRGRNVPRERLLEVAEHYQHFGGVSPINQQNRELIAALRGEFAQHGPHLPIYWGNRNWHPLLPDTLAQMAADGVKRAIALFTSAFSSYSGCRQYRENIAAASEIVGKHAPQIDKLRMFFNHPGFIEPMLENTRSALEKIPADRRNQAHVVYTAHSIPLSMAKGCRYELQLREACQLMSTALGRENDPLVYQSRSGPPQQPWLEPDIGDHLRTVAQQGNVRDVVIVPIGFISDHMEVLFDLDTEAKAVCAELGLNYFRAATVGTHPKFVRMIRDLIIERMTPGCERVTLGSLGPSHDICPEDCCLPPSRP
jgi:ferrochelatase